jgi:hypothetical protein
MAAPLSKERARETFSEGFNTLKAIWPSGIQDNLARRSRRPLLKRVEVRILPHELRKDLRAT